MSVTINLRFLAGRYHATPWGRHVNEGAVEWPPSPWRVLRAFVAAAHTIGADDPRLAILLGTLREPPLVALPPATPAHTRHFMPGAGTDRTLVFDTFVALNRDATLGLFWPNAHLHQDTREYLAALLLRLSYFGRSEAWCEATLAEDTTPPVNCRPLNADESPRDDEEVVSLLAADSDSPLDRLLEALSTGTAVWRRQRLMYPPSSQVVRYARTRTALVLNPPPTRATRMLVRPELVRYALSSPVLPLLHDAIAIGDAARRAAMALYGRLHGQATSPLISGRSPDGNPLRGNRHAHYLPTDEDADGRIDHLTIWCPEGFTEADCQALQRLTILRWRERPDGLAALFVGQGGRERFRAPVTATARRWRSVTPFVLVRHPKVRGGRSVESPEDQVRLELLRRGFPEPGIVRRVRPGRGSWLEFRRWRRGGGAAAGAWGFGFEIEFTEPVSGPVTGGYGAHYGLGLFLPTAIGSASHLDN